MYVATRYLTRKTREVLLAAEMGTAMQLGKALGELRRAQRLLDSANAALLAQTKQPYLPFEEWKKQRAAERRYASKETK